MIIGVDEVGLGAWAGPLTVCAFAAPSESWAFQGLRDSKKLSKNAREKVAEALVRAHPNAYEVLHVEAQEIDTRGIQAALVDALDNVALRLIGRVGIPDRVIIDGDHKNILGAEFFPKADDTFPAVMAASVLAKVARDRLMLSYERRFPGYGFGSNVGYGTSKHREGLRDHGVCEIHRRSYSPMRGLFPRVLFPTTHEM